MALIPTMQPFRRSRSSPHPRDLRLRTMRSRATALLIAVVLVYLGAVSLRAEYPGLAYVAAAAEAGIVGALADWFAVVALFHHPLNIRAIPHTNIIPRNKGRLARQMGEFIQREFLSPEVVLVRIREFNPARRLSEWLFRSENVAAISTHITRVVAYSLTALDDTRVRHFLYEVVGRNLQQVDLARVAGAVLDMLTHDERHHGLLEAALAAADDVLARDETRAFIAEELARQFWLLQLSERLGLDLSKPTAAKIVEVGSRLLSEVRTDKQHELRRRFDEAMATFVARLRYDPTLRARVEQLKRDALDSPAIRGYVETLWAELHAWMQADVNDAASAIRAHAASIIEFLGRQLHEDRAVQDWINEQILAQAPPFIERYRSDFGRFIEEQVNSWTNEKLVLEFERAIGPDLQYIRINGTVVGAAAGLTIYSLTEFVFGS